MTHHTVTDRLAWMTYIEGSLAATLAKGIDASRAPFKALRDAENGLSGRRNIRAGFQNQIARIEHDQRHGMEQKLAELKRQLQKAEEDDKAIDDWVADHVETTWHSLGESILLFLSESSR